MAKVAPVTRFRCAYAGCEKRYSSTDGVRKHAKKAHHSWIKSIDALLEGGGRQAMLEGAGLSKPSTYSIVESSSGVELALRKLGSFLPCTAVPPRPAPRGAASSSRSYFVQPSTSNFALLSFCDGCAPGTPRSRE